MLRRRSLLAVVAAAFQLPFACAEEISAEAIFKCADAGIPECQYKAAKLIESGSLADRDLIKAKGLYEKAYSGGYEQAAPDILRLAKGSSASPHEVEPGSSVAKSISSVPSPKVEEGGGFSLLPVHVVGKMSRELRFGAVYIGQSESHFVSSTSNSKCSDEVEDGVKIRECIAMVPRKWGRQEVQALFQGGRLYALFAILEEKEICEKHIVDFTSSFGKPVARWRMKFFSSLSGTNSKVWGDSKTWAVMAACDRRESEAAESGLVALLGLNEAQQAVFVR